MEGTTRDFEIQNKPRIIYIYTYCYEDITLSYNTVKIKDNNTKI